MIKLPRQGMLLTFAKVFSSKDIWMQCKVFSWEEELYSGGEKAVL